MSTICVFVIRDQTIIYINMNNLFMHLFIGLHKYIYLYTLL